MAIVGTCERNPDVDHDRMAARWNRRRPWIVAGQRIRAWDRILDAIRSDGLVLACRPAQDVPKSRCVWGDRRAHECSQTVGILRSRSHQRQARVGMWGPCGKGWSSGETPTSTGAGPRNMEGRPSQRRQHRSVVRRRLGAASIAAAVGGGAGRHRSAQERRRRGGDPRSPAHHGNPRERARFPRRRWRARGRHPLRGRDGPRQLPRPQRSWTPSPGRGYHFRVDPTGTSARSHRQVVTTTPQDVIDGGGQVTPAAAAGAHPLPDPRRRRVTTLLR